MYRLLNGSKEIGAEFAAVRSLMFVINSVVNLLLNGDVIVQQVVLWLHSSRVSRFPVSHIFFVFSLGSPIFSHLLKKYLSNSWIFL